MSPTAFVPSPTLKEYGVTALMLAVWQGFPECVKLLCANPHGVNKQGVRCSSINLQSSMGLTALHIAAKDGWRTENIIKVLIATGADKTLKEQGGGTPEALARMEGR